MSRIAEIREELGELRTQVATYGTLMETEKRGLTEEESTKLDGLTTDIRSRERQLETLAEIGDLRPEERQRPASEREPELKPGDGSEERSKLSIGERAIRSAAYQRAKKDNAFDSRNKDAEVDFGVSLSRSETRALITNTPTSGGALVEPDVQPLRPRRLTPIDQILQLVNQGSTEKDQVVVPIDTSTNFDDADFVPAPADVATASEKPETGITFGKLEFPVRLVATLLPVWRAQLDDVPFLKSYIDNRLTYQVRRRFARGLIAGTGAGESFVGILNSPGVGTQARGADTVIDAISRAIENIQLTENDPTAVLMHPSDLWTIRRLRNNLAVTNPDPTDPTTVETGDYVFGGPNGISLPSPWGLQPVPTMLIPKGTALVGDFSQATLFMRQGLQVFTSDSHKDWFSKNIIAVLAEARAAFGVEEPRAFTKVTGL